MKTPLVSIVLPVYNRKDLLPRTLKSLVNQTYRNIEVMLVDDGSSEDIKSVVDSFDDPRIRYFRHDSNMGVAAARNTALKQARGEFISFLDGDDEYLPEKTEKQVNILLENAGGEDIKAVYCGMLVEKQGKYSIYTPKVCKWNILLQQTMAKKQAVERNGFFDTDFHHAEDTDYIYRLKNACKIAFLPEPLVIFHSTPGSHTKNLEALNKSTELFIRKHSDTLSRDEKSQWFYYVGNRYILIREIDEAYTSFFRAFVAYPLNERAFRKLLRLFPFLLFNFFRNKHR